MQALDKDLRGALEKTVKAARETAEIAAFAALDQLGVGHDKPEAFLSDAEKALRNRLRTHGKQLGDARDSKSTNPTYGKQEVQHLVQEVAYQHWHRMLFARFLADNDLLMYDGVAVTIEECDELAADEGAKNGWELAGKLAARMLPQVFKPGSPVFELTFAPEHQSELERLLKTLPDAVFKASDSLGWVYQFWQADNKERINKSEVKIGADELPAVTQLFTEPYMVAFLLHNSLGAWWVTRHPETPCPVDLTYLRFTSNKDGSNAVPPAPTFAGQIPAAGKFEGWPDSLADFKLLDPCCGSGHFLVAAFLMLVPMRMVAESLSAKEAVNRVLAENIHGLELDPRCVEIAVFSIALEAWRYPDVSGKPIGVREIPAPNVACCGLKVSASEADWESLVSDEMPGAVTVKQGLRRLHQTFMQAPLLGSLLDPHKTYKGDLFAADYQTLVALLDKALAQEATRSSKDTWEIAISARGLLDAAKLLNSRYHLVITNVPYLGRGQQTEALRDFCESHYPNAKSDLANVFLERCLELSASGGRGVAQIVMPQNWLFLGSYKKQRDRLLREVSWNLLVRLGEGGFESPQAAGAFTILLTQTNSRPTRESIISGIDASGPKSASEKATILQQGELITANQESQLGNPDARITLSEEEDLPLLSKFADGLVGLQTGDDPRFVGVFWEHGKIDHSVWEFMQNTPEELTEFAGMNGLVKWEMGLGPLLKNPASRPTQGAKAIGKAGIAIHRMRTLFPYHFARQRLHQNVAVVIPKNPNHLAAIWCYCASSEYTDAVRRIDQKLNVTNATLVKVPFDFNHWSQIAADQFPHGLPKPYSNDPTQWIFHGHPTQTKHVLQVAVARLVGYEWPAENDEDIELSEEARSWIAHSKMLRSHADKDGIVCIPPVGQESSASDRILNLLADAYGQAWGNEVLAQLLSAADHAGKSLETWLRDKFFTQHCTLFGNRPFVWHVWDGLRDGFSALVNYHKLDYKTLEALIYTYLGDWIGRQKRDADNGVDGAQEKLAAAEVLKKRLELILAGEAPYDIFVRWKPIEEQPIGWNPDLNDGVRINIRPFLSVPDVGKRGAGVLRDKPKSLHWEKDRGSDVPSAPWYELGLQYGGKVGDRINDHHLSLAEKRAAREKAEMIKSVNNYPVSQLFDIEAGVVYAIPRYQREYTWKMDQWESLFDDIEENDPGYFLGSIICINQTTDTLAVQRLEVVDGQQRLTTLSLLFAALYQSLKLHEKDLDDDQRVELINLKRKLVLKKGDDQLRVIPQIQNNNQNDYRAVLSDVGVISTFDTPAYAGNRKIFRAFRYFQSRIEEMVDGKKDRLASIMGFLDKVSQACLVKIEVASHADAYTLFESLNNRGMPLTAIDLIKNKLLARLETTEPGKVDHYFDVWNKLLGYLGDDYSIQERFFRHYYNAFKDELNVPFRKDGDKKKDPLGPVATRSNLIQIFEKLINQDAKSHLQDIRAAGQLYALMLSRNTDEAWIDLDKPLKDLDRIQGAPSYLLMLYLLVRREALKLTVEQLSEIAQLLVCFFVRRNLTDTPPTRDLTRLFMATIDKLSALTGDAVVATVRDELLAVSASDASFRSKLEGSIYEENSGVTRFILCALAEKSMTKETWVDLWKFENKQFVWTIEHIFPQGDNIPAAWVTMIAAGDAKKAKEVQQTHVHKLGNLTISGFNSALGNKSFEEKRDRTDRQGRAVGYKNGLKLNADLATAKAWSVAQINARTTTLVDQVISEFAMTEAKPCA